MPGYLRYSVLLLLFLDGAFSTTTQNGSAHTRPSTNEPASSASSALSKSNSRHTAAADNAICPSRTANYITHTLPQQCLRTNRASVAASDMYNGTSMTNVTASLPPDQPQGGKIKETHAPSEATSAVSTSDEAPKPSAETTKVKSITTAASDTPASSVQEPAETDSPLDNANFLSFEDWKRQNLVKAGQSPDNIGARSQALDGERKRPGINNALDTLGEESEIELDFYAFGSSHDDSSRERPTNQAGESGDAQTAVAPHSARSRDAGKTCKERTNYASFDCAATILKNNPESKSGSSVLVENKDSYMLNKCSADNKFVIVELCSDILIDTIVLANYEFFSSIFRHFRISVSDRYPVKMEKWKDLGTFEARNTREVQAFLVENPLIWARYLRIEFLTHYGNEYYCPVSLLRVHGTTMMDEFRHQEEIARGETQDDEITVEADVSTPAQTAVSQEPISASPEEKSTVQATANAETKPLETSTGSSPDSTSEDDRKAASAVKSDLDESLNKCQIQSVLPWEDSSLAFTHPTCATDDQSSNPSNATTTSSSVTHTRSSSGESSTSTTRAAATTTESKPVTQATTSSERPKASNQSAAAQSDPSSKTSHAGQNGNVTNTTASNTSTVANNTTNTSSTSRPRDESTAASSSKTSGQDANSTRTGTGSTSAQAAQPSTQESFFKSVHKRLQQLESNSTLSLQYIEEQSRILRDAFSKVEKRQVTATTNFLSHLNSTVMGELQGFRQAYDQLWQSTVIELEGQREQYQREMLALSTRLTLVADELVWQKRMGIVQSTLLLLCLALVLFNRTGNSALVEMPLLQQMMNKSQAALRAGWESPTGSRSPDNRSPENRSPENRSPVSLFRKKLWRHSTEPVSGHATDFTDSRPESRDATNARPDVTLEAPTPPITDSDSEDEGAWKEVPEVQNGPATPRGTRDALGSPAWADEDLVRPSSSLG